MPYRSYQVQLYMPSGDVIYRVGAGTDRILIFIKLFF
jgi:hypothetical protein